MRSCVFLIILTVQSLSSYFIACNVLDCEQGDTCVGGIVKMDSECESFLNADRKAKKSFEICGYDSMRPLICCLQFETRIEEISVGSRAKKACESYGIKPDDSQETLDSSRRIINGVSCHIAEIPHFAALGYQTLEDKNASFNCGGALISNRFIITAAHCCKDSKKPVVVRLGRVSSC